MKNWSTALIALLIPKIGYQATKNKLKNINLFYFSSKEEGKEIEAVSLSRNATPTINSFVTGSDDIHIDSVRQASY
jgi:hypothetical protein